jgi:hypothetical protein
VVRGWRLTAWAMARPQEKPLLLHIGHHTPTVSVLYCFSDCQILKARVKARSRVQRQFV